MSRFTLSAEDKELLKASGIESFHGPAVSFPNNLVCEAPCSLKWMSIEHSLFMGAFSYAVSGFYFGVKIGRYTSIGESVQIGRQDHHTDWLSTSPFQYLHTKLFDIGDDFSHASEFHTYRSHLIGTAPGMEPKITNIQNDVWIGHGSFIKAGVTIGHGAIVGAHSVVVRDVPPYAVVAGNPAIVKKYRIPENIIESLLTTNWWDFAPWQLKKVNFNEIEVAVDQLTVIRDSGAKPFVPDRLIIKDLKASP